MRWNASTDKKFSEKYSWHIPHTVFLSVILCWLGKMLGESKLKLSLLPSQIKTESYFSTHELLGPGLPIPLSLSNTFKHLTPCSFLQRQAQITDQFQGKRLEVVELTTGTCNAGFHALDSTGSCTRASQTPGEWLERHQFRTELLLIFF